MAAGGQGEPDPTVLGAADRAHHHGHEAVLAGGLQQGLVEHPQHAGRWRSDQPQRPQRLAHLAGQHGRLRAVAADVAERDHRVATRRDRAEDVVEVAADPQRLPGGLVGADQLDPVRLGQLRRQQVGLQDRGGVDLLAVEPGRRDRGAGAGREDAGEDLVLGGELGTRAMPGEDERAGRLGVARQRA